jgi:hypothetical protein
MGRVVVKARMTRVKLGSRAAEAHIRYLQSDGTARDDERGRLYAAETSRRIALVMPPVGLLMEAGLKQRRAHHILSETIVE